MARKRWIAVTGGALVCLIVCWSSSPASAQPPSDGTAPDAPAPAADSAIVTQRTPGVADTPDDSPQSFSVSVSNAQLTQVGTTLLLILVLAILLETGLATVFNWRLYLRYFEGRGWKTPIAVVVAYLFVNQFGIDAIAEILGGFSGINYPGGFGGKLLTALIVAGGSNAVFRLFEQLGIRSPLQGAARARDLREECSLKLEVTREQVAASKPVGVKLNDVLVGTIPANQNKFGGMFGHKIAPGTLVLKVFGTGDDGNVRETEETIPVAPGAAVFVPLRL